MKHQLELSKKNKLCIFFKNGNCDKKDNCPFYHPPKTNNIVKSEIKPKDEKAEQILKII